MYATAQFWTSKPSEKGETRGQQSKPKHASSIISKFIVKQSLFGLAICLFYS